MGEFMKALYDKFYDPLQNEDRKREIEECHQKLIDALEKPERKLVLKIIDNMDCIADDLSIDSFSAGFCMAWRLCNEIMNYKRLRE